MAKEQERGWSLPAGLEGLWAEQEGTVRRQRAGLTLYDIVVAGVEIADRQGLGEVTMAQLASELGFTTMALYRHVPSKAALLVLMVDAGVGRPEPTARADVPGWRGQLDTLARALSTTYRAHPWLLDIPITGPPATPNNVRWLEAGLSALRETALDVESKLAVWLLIVGYVRGKEQFFLELARGALAETEDETAARTYGEMLRPFLEPGAFPETVAALNQGAFDFDGEDDRDTELDFGLQRVLDGVAVYIDARPGV